MYNQTIKRIFDISVSAVLLLVLSPVILIISLLLAVYNKGDVYFTQYRPGLHAKRFRLVKFKTMRDLHNAKGEMLPDKVRITAFGKFIRKYSLDELPQLINVLKGDMSLVGPRPLLERYLSLYNKDQARRHEVKPGITGWAQVNGRNAISWQDKFELDVYYVDNISFVLDLKILVLTLMKVSKSSDINASQTTTMRPFEGDN